MTDWRASLLRYAGKEPRIAAGAFVAPGTRVIGDVEIGARASLWYNVVVRGDVNYVRIGARTNIQDGSVIHVDGPKPGRTKGHPTLIGEDVLIGHMAMVHGCIINDRAFVGLGAIVMDGCEMESDTMLAAGAMLTPGKRIPSGQIWAGRPARYLRDLTETERVHHMEGIERYMALAEEHHLALRG
jgi:gamma-carbonic anhydrase